MIIALLFFLVVGILAAWHECVCVDEAPPAGASAFDAVSWTGRRSERSASERSRALRAARLFSPGRASAQALIAHYMACPSRT